MLTVALFEPEIPPNTGNIARTCAAAGIPLCLIGKLGFSTDDRHLKRAGLDYWKFVNVSYHESFEKFEKEVDREKIVLFTRKAEKLYTDWKFTGNEILVFGKETMGLPESLLEKYYKKCLRIPTVNVRSLNLSNSVAIAVYEALRQTGFSEIIGHS